MTDKERLEEIKLKFNNTIDTMLYVPYKDMKFLIEQAERVEKLETQLSINTNNMKQLQKENERYKQALEKIRGLYPLRNVGYKVSEIRQIVIKALEVTEK